MHYILPIRLCKLIIQNVLYIFFFPKIIYYAYTGLLLVLLKEGQVYPVRRSLLPQPACGPLILLFIVGLASDFPPVQGVCWLVSGVGLGCVGWRGRGVCIDSLVPHLKRFRPAPSSHWGRCTLIRCAGTRDPRKQ